MRCTALSEYTVPPLRNRNFEDEACSLQTLTGFGINNLFSSTLNAWLSGMLSATIIRPRQVLRFHFLEWNSLWLNISVDISAWLLPLSMLKLHLNLLKQVSLTLFAFYINSEKSYRTVYVYDDAFFLEHLREKSMFYLIKYPLVPFSFSHSIIIL